MANSQISMGVCYGPYHQADKTKTDAMADMAIIAKHFSKIRTYSVHDADVNNLGAASKYGLKVGLGIWIFKGDKMRTYSEIDLAVKQAEDHSGTVLHFVVGNEVDRGEQNYAPEEVLAAMAYARTRKDSSPHKEVQTIPVTTCFSGTVLNPDDNAKAAKWLDVVRVCQDIVYLTVYPWYGNSPPDNIDTSMKWSYDHGMKQVEALGHRVIIGEIGWPSAGGPSDRKPTTVPNEQTNFNTTNTWVSGNNFLKKAYETFWFEIFDEPWKTNEGPFGPYWGLYGSGAAPAAKFTIPTRQPAPV
jgi:exo-beta-1,3-glucanase (GH17 family)